MARLLLSFFCSISFSWALVVGTYNVENLFDDIHQGTEYESYIPGSTQGWDKEMAAKKLANISKAVLKIDADILGLQEVENEQILAKLAKKTGYPYYAFTSSFKAATGVGILSRHPIIFTQSIKAPKGRFRPALYVKIEVEDNFLEIIVVHWPSLKNPNKKREEAARAIAPIMKDMKEGIILGDFNVPFDLKNTISRFWGPIEEPKGWFDPWVGVKERWSHNFFGQKKVLDRMLLSEKLFDGEGFDYVCGSFKPLHVEPFLKDGVPNRWQIENRGKGAHVGKGYSDHIPLILKLDTDPFECKGKKVDIEELFKLPLGEKLFFLEKAKVIYTHKDGMIFADSTGSIHVFKPGFTLPVGTMIDAYVYNISDFGGMREIRALHIDKKYENRINPLDFMLNERDLKQASGGSVVAFIEGYFKNGKLETKHGNITLFTKDKSLLPKKGEFIQLERVRVNEYRGKKELILEERE